MTQPPGGASLTEETDGEPLVERRPGGKDLECNAAPQGLLLRFVDDPHSASADFPQESELAEPFPRRELGFERFVERASLLGRGFRLVAIDRSALDQGIDEAPPSRRYPKRLRARLDPLALDEPSGDEDLAQDPVLAGEHLGPAAPADVFEPLDSRVQGLSVHTKDARGPDFVPLRRSQCLANRLVLRPAERARAHRSRGRSQHLLGKMALFNDLDAEHGDAAKDVLQLAHVARPWIGEEAPHRALGEAGRLTPVRGAALHQLRDEQRDVLRPLSQRGQVQDQHIDPIVQIPAELAAGHQLIEVSVGRGDEADVTCRVS